MVECGISEIQAKPSIFKELSVSKIVDKRKHQDIGYFISSKYKKFIDQILENIEKEEKREKLKKLKNYQDLEFLEIGIDDGIK